MYEQLCGGQPIGMSASTLVSQPAIRISIFIDIVCILINSYLSEKETAYQNLAIAYLLKERQVFIDYHIIH